MAVSYIIQGNNKKTENLNLSLGVSIGITVNTLNDLFIYNTRKIDFIRKLNFIFQHPGNYRRFILFCFYPLIRQMRRILRISENIIIGDNLKFVYLIVYLRN